MYSLVSTVPNSATRPTSLRPRSTSMTCSAHSFSLARSSSSSWRSSSGPRPRGRVPAIGRTSTTLSVRRTSAARVGDDLERVRQVVEHAHRVAEHEHRIGNGEVVLGSRGQALEPSHRVVGEEADRAAAEARQPWQRDRLVLAQEVAELLERMLGALPHLGALADLAAIAARDEDARRAAAQQREPPPLLATLDALEQERIGAILHLAEGRDRRVLVGEQLAIDRDQLAAAGERAEPGE